MNPLRFGGKADPYLEWGYATNFRSFRPPGDDARSTPIAARGERSSVDDRSFSQPSLASQPVPIGLLVEWLSTGDAREALRIASALGVFVAAVYAGSADAAFPAPLRTIWSLGGPSDRLIDFIDRAFDHLARVELAAPVTTRRNPLERVEHHRSDTSILVGILDDGCAFANTRFMQSGGTRLLWLWDQEPASYGWPVAGLVSPSPLVDFGYGGHWHRADLDQRIGTETPEASYRSTNLVSLRRAATHGTHILDLAAGDAPWDIVFVQFPRAGIEDPSGRWLSRNALDGFFYVIACAGPKTDKIVVNLSWGPQTDAHDGQGILETAFDQVIAEQAALGRTLVVSLAAGNSFNTQGHACFPIESGGRFDWVIPPDGEANTFMEIWWPLTMALDQISLAITAPTGEVFHVGGPTSLGTLLLAGYGAVVLVDLGSRGIVAMMTIDPTESPVSPRGLAGRWKIELPAVVPRWPCVGAVHVYVARADHNMGAHRRATTNYLSDAALGEGRFRSPAQRFDEVPGSVVQRNGTLNGIGTGELPRTVGGYRHSDLQPAPYSSSGPTRGPRVAPDFACITDRSPVRQGIRAAGVRSGTKVLLVGTSTASPQLVRKSAMNHWATEAPPPPDQPARQGAALLKADPELVERG